jgi:DNA primase
MATHFPTEYIDALLKRVDMMQVMSENGIEVRTGSSDNNFYIASFCCGKTDFDNGRIKKSTQTYKCMSCFVGGNAIHFMQNVVGKSFPEAVIELARMIGLELPYEDPAEIEKRQRKEKALKLAAEFYSTQTNYEYMLSRGISEEVLVRHKVGYAPGGRTLRNHLEKFGYVKQELLDYKLINSKGLDSFFYRSIVPVYMYGKVIDLYGRAVNDEKVGIKHFYLNGQDILGGFDLINPNALVLLFEAAIDRLVAESHGIDNGVDPGGSQKFTASHAKQLKKKGVSKVMIIYDGDSSGREGAMKSGLLLAQEGIQVWIGELPDKQDAANMLQEYGKEAFVETLNRPKTFEQFKLYYELAKYSLSDIEQYLIDMKSKLSVSKLRE